MTTSSKSVRRYLRGILTVAMLIIALVLFEILNYSTTNFALSNLLVKSGTVGVWLATIGTLLFCAIDYLGIAPLFSPEQEPSAVWYQYGAWLLGAAVNACLTWWAVSLSIFNHYGSLVATSLVWKSIPVIVAGAVWVIRVVIIGMLSFSGLRISKVR